MKKHLLYVSPLPPLESGISDYSVILINALLNYFEITLCTGNYDADLSGINEKLALLKYGVDKIDVSEYDYTIYNIGNNPYYHDYIYKMCLEHPGMVILHDYVLYYLFVGYYQESGNLFSKIYEQYGTQMLLDIKEAVRVQGSNLLEQKKLASIFPMNRELLKSNNKFMVHSQYAFERVAEYTNNVKKINMIQQISEKFQCIEKKTLFDKYGIPENAFIIASFGIIAETKLNHIICKAIKEIESDVNEKICYVMVGEGDYVDHYIDNNLIYKTGYVDMDEFDSFVEHADLVLNLRHPSMGETSAALIKILQIGKCCFINDEGWFAEIPDNCAVKLPIDDIENNLEKLLTEYISNESLRRVYEFNAKNYIEKEYDSQNIVGEIINFLDLDI